MHPTDEVVLTLTGKSGKSRAYRIPASLGRRVERLIRDEATPEFVAASDVFPQLADPAQRAAALLRGSRHKEGMTQLELADRLGIRQSHLSEMENGRRPIGRTMARRLGEVLACDYRMFL